MSIVFPIVCCLLITQQTDGEIAQEKLRHEAHRQIVNHWVLVKYPYSKTKVRRGEQGIYVYQVPEILSELGDLGDSDLSPNGTRDGLYNLSPNGTRDELYDKAVRAQLLVETIRVSSNNKPKVQRYWAPHLEHIEFHIAEDLDQRSKGQPSYSPNWSAEEIIVSAFHDDANRLGLLSLQFRAEFTPEYLNECSYEQIVEWSARPYLVHKKLSTVTIRSKRNVERIEIIPSTKYDIAVLMGVTPRFLTLVPGEDAALLGSYYYRIYRTDGYVSQLRSKNIQRDGVLDLN